MPATKCPLLLPLERAGIAGRTSRARMKIGCAVVTHNSASEIASLLPSLARLDIEALVVADNGSRDSTVAIVRDWSSSFAVAVLERMNDGYAAGVNAAVAALRRQEIDLIILLNPDTVVVRADLAAVADIFRFSPALGSLCPVMVASHGQTFDSLGLRLTPWGSVADAGQGAPYNDVGTRVVRGVIGPCGGGGVYRTTALESVGTFDERFFLYYEDADLALRLRQRGWSTVTSDALTLEHRRSGLGSLREDAGRDRRGAALRHRQHSYEVFVQHSPIPLGRRLLGRPAARVRRLAVSARLCAWQRTQAR